MSRFIPLSQDFWNIDLFDLEVPGNAQMFALLCYCIRKANYSNNGRFAKGEFAEEYETISETLHLSKRKVSKWMNGLIDKGYIKRTGKCKYLVVDYEKYTNTKTEQNNSDHKNDEEEWVQL